MAIAGCGGGSSDGPTTPANQAPTVSIDTPAANATFTSNDTVVLTATASDADGSVLRVEFLSDGTKIGESTARPFTYSWTNPPLGSHALTVRAIDNTGASALSSSRQITVSAPPNQPPAVSIDTPAANANFLTTDTVILAATASDADGSVLRVEFLSNGTKIGESTSRPFTYSWSNPPAGTHTLTVRAFDNTGAGTVSGSRQITISLPNQAPTVSMTAPANNFKTNAPATVLLSANASDSDGTIAKVEFFRINPAAPVFDATTLVGQATAVGTPPAFQFTAAALAAGTYNFAARATDNKGATATSGTVQVIVNALPTVSIAAPVAGAIIIPGTNFTLRATAGDADGSVSKVEFFLNGSATPLGQAARVGTTNEYTLAWTAVTGAVSVTARATDNDGAQTTTTSVAANVPPNVLPSVTLANPTAGTNAPTILNLSASASDGDGSVTGVEFAYTFNSVTTKVAGVLDGGNWTATVPIGAAQFGTYTVTATATDNLGGKTTSPSKNITVAANVPPAVNITSLAAQVLDAGNAPKTLTLTASASDSDGIAKVEFFNGVTKLGEVMAAPYQYSWAGVTAGNYSITAKATDAVGSASTSTAQTLVVTPNLEGPWSTLSTAQKAGFTLVPNRQIDDGTNDAVEVMTAIGPNTATPKFVAAMSQALRKLADLPLNPTSSYVSCPDGGTTMMQPDSAKPGESYVNYNNCKIGGFTFYGGADMAPYTQVDNTTYPSPAPPPPVNRLISSEAKYYQLAADRFRIVVKAVKVTGNGAPEPANEAFPNNAFGFAYLECTVTGGTRSCFSNFQNAFTWANDLAWTNWSDNGTAFPAIPFTVYATDDPYTLNGTIRPCEADPQPENENASFCQNTPPTARHIKYENMTNRSGRAIVYGNNGWSVVTRMPPESAGVEILRVQRTLLQITTDAQGTVYPAGQGPLENYRCTVSLLFGYYSCAKFTP